MTKTDDAKSFELAILFWFYKEPAVTKNHLELIRKHNPSRKIYGLFGGDRSEATQYRELLDQHLDDFWIYPGTYGDDARTKWIHGDLMILDWYDKRGRHLEWESIAVTQWDMLLFTDIHKIVPGIKPDQVFFSGYRSLEPVVENRWVWTKPDGRHREDYLNFCEFVSGYYGYTGRLKCCLYIFEVLTRKYLDRYLEIPDKKLGMLEYKNPTLASIFGIDVYEHDIGVFWGEEDQPSASLPLNAMPVLLQKPYIDAELASIDGWRLFHPYEESWPID